MLQLDFMIVTWKRGKRKEGTAKKQKEKKQPEAK